ncbi:MAG: DUF4249 family protein [Rhodothermales bacterium]|nr:DUF4249 family protein [Rhodothermales bacterium]MBO6779084.1 DUF4249 family protein [Rhodothermales bacterium]
MTRALIILLALTAVVACDTVPSQPEALVLEGYVQPGQPLPGIRVSRSVPLRADRSPEPVAGASVSTIINGRIVSFAEQAPGWYLPLDSTVVQTGDGFSVQVTAEGRTARASGEVPPRLRLDSVRVNTPAEPIAAVLLDSLVVGLDSLALPARSGFIYPVEVTVWWQAPPALAGNFWVETSIQPEAAFSSSLIDFFLRPRSVLEEPAGQALSWTGIYAVPVAGREDPMPEHQIRVAAVRGTVDYARFALSRDQADRREPEGNVLGGAGIITGIALDSTRVYVR